MPTRGDVMVRQRGTGRARAPRLEVFGMQACPLDRPENRNSSVDREWVSRALVHPPAPASVRLPALVPAVPIYPGPQGVITSAPSGTASTGVTAPGDVGTGLFSSAGPGATSGPRGMG